MEKRIGKKILAGLLGTAMLCSALPAATTSVQTSAEDSTAVIYSTGFEDGTGISDFCGRGSAERNNLETITATTAQAHSGNYSMCVSDRKNSWNGPMFFLDDRCEAGVQYTVSAWVRAEWYNKITLSMQYTDSSGEHYSNINSIDTQGNEWVEFSNVKFSFAEDVTKVAVYFECNDTSNIYVDDFEIKTAPVYQIQQDITSLKDAYAQYFKIGTAVTTDELAPQSAKDLILKHFNSVTLGNELKPDSILDQAASQANGNNVNPQVNIASARTILNFCRDNNIPVRGHVLVWHQQTPDWFFKENFSNDGAWVSKEIMLQRMENYIKNVFETLKAEYPTVTFYAWDVVNEAWLNDGSCRPAGTQAEGSNNSPWVKIFGDNSFIEPAFEYARTYAPEGCKLYYNDFNEYETKKTEAIYNMAMELKEKGLIDGIGMQSHLDVNYPTVSAYRKALDKFASTGLDIQVTELDITTSDTSEAGFEKQAQIYRDIMDACVEYADSISAVVFWGTTDDKSWRASRYPLLFNEDFTAKPAFYAIVDKSDVPIVTTTTATITETTTTTTSKPNFVRGDVNLDGFVTLADAVLLQKYLINTTTLTQTQFDLGDMDRNAKINGFDLAHLKRILLQNT